MNNSLPDTSPACALTIAGSDSCGGAGIQADLKTFSAWQVEGASVITAITAQNTGGVASALPLPARLVADQLDAVLDDIPVAAAKTGMMANAGIIVASAETLTSHARDQLVIYAAIVSLAGDR